MKVTPFNLLLCFIAISSSILISCSEDLGFGNKIEQDEANIVSVAKQIYQNQGSSVCLPNPKANKNNASRSSFSYLAELDPLWNEAFTYNQGTETVVIVPLNCDEDIRSTLSIIDGDETTYQFAKVFSRMIVKPSEGENGIYVLSYMPESNYASSYPNLEAEMGYNPTEVDFTGLIVSSRITGEMMKGFLYNEGVLGHYFAPATQECHDHNCTENHNHNHEHKGLSLKFNLQNANQSRSTTYNSSEEEKHCPYCYKLVGKCDCINWSEYCIYCDNYKDMCICNIKLENCPICMQNPCRCNEGLDNQEPCPTCKQVDCTCNPGATEPCKYCGEDPCVCNEPDPVDTCDICNEYPCICCKQCNTYPCACTCEGCGELLKNCICCKQCNTSPCVCICEGCGELLKNCICETNTSPISYNPHDNDRLVGLIDECVSPNTCCSMAVLEMAYRAFGGTEMNQEMFAQYYTQFNYMSPNEETILNNNDSFITHFFETSSLYTMVSAINSGDVVVVRKNGHYLLVFGLQYDGDVIYADPHEGGIYAVNENYFSGCDAFEIGGINQSRMRMLAQ